MLRPMTVLEGRRNDDDSTLGHGTFTRDIGAGAHAVAVAESFPTRDRGFHATCFPELKKA